MVRSPEHCKRDVGGSLEDIFSYLLLCNVMVFQDRFYYIILFDALTAIQDYSVLDDWNLAFLRAPDFSSFNRKISTISNSFIQRIVDIRKPVVYHSGSSLYFVRTQ